TLAGTTALTGSPTFAFGFQKMANARAQGVTDPFELAKHGLVGAIEGKMFHRVGELPPVARTLGLGALGAAQTLGEPLLEGKPLPTPQQTMEGAATNVAIDAGMRALGVLGGRLGGAYATPHEAEA